MEGNRDPNSAEPMRCSLSVSRTCRDRGEPLLRSGSGEAVSLDSHWQSGRTWSRLSQMCRDFNQPAHKLAALCGASATHLKQSAAEAVAGASQQDRMRIGGPWHRVLSPPGVEFPEMRQPKQTEAEHVPFSTVQHARRHGNHTY